MNRSALSIALGESLPLAIRAIRAILARAHAHLGALRPRRSRTHARLAGRYRTRARNGARARARASAGLSAPHTTPGCGKSDRDLELHTELCVPRSELVGDVAGGSRARHLTQMPCGLNIEHPVYMYTRTRMEYTFGEYRIHLNNACAVSGRQPFRRVCIQLVAWLAVISSARDVGCATCNDGRKRVCEPDCLCAPLHVGAYLIAGVSFRAVVIVWSQRLYEHAI